jgi:hypothetical protein
MSATKNSTATRPDLDVVILQVIPADARWRAIYEDNNDGHAMPLVCFALVEVRRRGKEPRRYVRPMVMCDHGTIGDVDFRHGLLRVESEADGALGHRDPCGMTVRHDEELA